MKNLLVPATSLEVNNKNMCLILEERSDIAYVCRDSWKLTEVVSKIYSEKTKTILKAGKGFNPEKWMV